MCPSIPRTKDNNFMVQVIHTPFGQEHPYEQLPEERTPRQPLAGEMFTIGIVARPPGAVQRVRVLAAVNGGEPVAVEAEIISNWQQEREHGVGAEFLERIVRVEQDVWRAQLTAPEQGSTLVYTLEADGAAYEVVHASRGSVASRHRRTVQRCGADHRWRGREHPKRSNGWMMASVCAACGSRLPLTATKRFTVWANATTL